jgi:hypothetical protein
MKIIINESRILDIAYMWLKSKYPDLRIRDNGDIDRSFRIHYYVNDDGGVIFEYHPKFKKVWVSQYYVYGTLGSMFGLDWGQSTEIIAKWLGEEYSIYPNRIYNYDDIEIVGDSTWEHSNAWLTNIRFNKNKFPNRRVIVRNKLAEYGIESRFIWKPLHLQPVFEKSESIIDGTAEGIYNQSLCLPSGTKLKLYQVDDICEHILSSLSLK